MEQKVTALIQLTLEGMGYELVRVLLYGGMVCRTLQVMAERQDRIAMSTEDCTTLSRAISAVLDAADPIKGSYVLEISSPGIERPLTRQEDFIRFAGHVIRLEMCHPVEGRRRFQGRLLGLTANGAIHLALPEGGEIITHKANVAKARLVSLTKGG